MVGLTPWMAQGSPLVTGTALPVERGNAGSAFAKRREASPVVLVPVSPGSDAGGPHGRPGSGRAAQPTEATDHEISLPLYS